MKNLFLVILVISLASCTDSDLNDANLTNEDFFKSDLKSKIETFNLSEQAVNSIINSVEFDEFGKVVSFEYHLVRNNLDDLSYLKFLKVVSDSDLITVYGDDDEVIFDSLDEIISTSVPEFSDAPTGPTPTLFHDKKNWRRPGCKRHSGSICILYL